MNMKNRNVRFAGVACYLPERVVTSDELLELIDDSSELAHDDFFKGVRERRWAGPDDTSAAMGTRAGRRLLEQLQRDPREVDLVIASATLNDMILPQVASGIQYGIGAVRASAITLDTGCASFVSGLIYGSALIRAGYYQRIVLVSVTNFAARAQAKLRNRSSMIPGDGAAAVLMEASTDQDALLGWWERSFGEYHGIMGIDAQPVGGERRRYWEPHEAIAFGFDRALLETIKTNARELVPRAILEALAAASLRVADLRLVLTHQPNRFLIECWRKTLGVDPSRCHDTLETYGNLFQSSIPVTLSDALERRLVQAGDVIAMGTFALAGELAAGAVIRWG